MRRARLALGAVPAADHSRLQEALVLHVREEIQYGTLKHHMTKRVGPIRLQQPSGTQQLLRLHQVRAALWQAMRPLLVQAKLRLRGPEEVQRQSFHVGYSCIFGICRYKRSLLLFSNTFGGL